MALNDDPWPKIIVAGILILCGVILGLDGFRDWQPKSKSEAGGIVSATPSQTIEASPAVPATPSLPKTIEDEEDEALLVAEGYHRTDYPHGWEKRGPDADAPFAEQQVIIYDESGSWLTTASVFVVLNDCAWVPGSAKYFKNRNNTDCKLETLLAFPEFRDRLSSARHLVFVGMESFLNAPQAASSDECNHQSLTECRADRLVTRTYSAYFTNETKVRPELWELDIGYAKTESPALEWYQRRALIIGIRNRRPALDVENAVTQIAAGTWIGTVGLFDYSEAATVRAQNIPYDDWSTGGAPDRHR
ncbi:MAG: hypothetical protein AAFW65_00235 [Pseudomonadota bacterium]